MAAKGRRKNNRVKGRGARPPHPSRHAPTEAERLMYRGERTQAEALAWGALREDPNDPRALNVMGRCLMDRGALDEAMEYFQRAGALDEPTPAVMSGYARAALRKSLFTTSEEAARRALELRDNLIEARWILAAALLNLGRLEEAEVEARIAEKAGPANPSVLNTLGNVLRRLGKLEEAQRTLEKGVRRNPKVALLHFNLGRVRMDQAEYDDAEKCFEKALSLQSDFTNARTHLDQVRALRNQTATIT